MEGLYKFCMKKFNIFVSPTIRIGSFNEYRGNEAGYKHDDGEGITDGIEAGEFPVILDGKNTNSMPGGLIDLDQNSGSKLILQSIQICAKRQLVNRHIFSCSLKKDNLKLINDLKTNSWYAIDNPEKFRREIVKIMRRNPIYKSNLIKADWVKVIYNDKNMVDLNKMINIKNNLENYATKNKKWHYQEEHRLVFTIEKLNGEILPIENNYVDLEITNKLRNCCSWNNI